MINDNDNDNELNHNELHLRVNACLPSWLSEYYIGNEDGIKENKREETKHRKCRLKLIRAVGPLYKPLKLGKCSRSLSQTDS